MTVCGGSPYTAACEAEAEDKDTDDRAGPCLGSAGCRWPAEECMHNHSPEGPGEARGGLPVEGPCEEACVACHSASQAVSQFVAEGCEPSGYPARHAEQMRRRLVWAVMLRECGA